MNIRIVSSDRRLYELCADTFDGASVLDWIPCSVAAERPCSVDEICIWDVASLSDLPSWSVHAGVSRIFFLVDEQELFGFYECMGHSDVNVILKPVTGPILAAFVNNATQKSTQKSGFSPLRSDRDQILQCLIQTNLRLQQIEQGRTSFLARTAHDFRAPLTAISGYCGLLLSDALGSLTGAQKEVIQRMQHSSQRLSRMTAGLFQLSTRHRANSQSKFEFNDFRDCVDQAVHEIAPYLRAKHIELSIDLQSSRMKFFFDRGQIEQLLVNLLENACKYTPSYGLIKVQVHGFSCGAGLSNKESTADSFPLGFEMNSPCCRVDVEDTGPGIPPEILEHMFEEYFTYSNGADRSGGGLGLAIAKMVVEHHHGRIWSENTPSGARLSFLLPVDLGAEQDAEEDSEVSTVADSVMNVKTSPSEGKHHAD